MDNKFEAVFIIKELEDSKLIDNTISKINKVIKQNKCKITAYQKLGVRKIVSPIYGQKDGFYYYINFEPNDSLRIDNLENKIKRNINTIKQVIMCVIVEMEND